MVCQGKHQINDVYENNWLILTTKSWIFLLTCFSEEKKSIIYYCINDIYCRTWFSNIWRAKKTKIHNCTLFCIPNNIIVSESRLILELKFLQLLWLAEFWFYKLKKKKKVAHGTHTGSAFLPQTEKMYSKTYIQK